MLEFLRFVEQNSNIFEKCLTKIQNLSSSEIVRMFGKSQMSAHKSAHFSKNAVHLNFIVI